MPKKFKRRELGDGYYIIYRIVSNGYGGSRPANIMLYHGEDLFVKEITDTLGNFVYFPETAPGEWEDKLAHTFYSATEYTVGFSNYADDLCLVAWLVQPDGRYWADEDGYGAEPDKEIWLYAFMDKNGDFVTPFSENHEDDKWEWFSLW